MVGRTREKELANHINLVTGILGSGKTVFITQITERIRKKKNWVIVNMNSRRDMLTSLAARLDSDNPAYLVRVRPDSQPVRRTVFWSWHSLFMMNLL